MNEQESLLRAWMLRELRGAGRVPYWLTDSTILKALDVARFVKPDRLRRIDQKRLSRVVSLCPGCKRTGFIGCVSCADASTTAVPAPDVQISILRTARQQNIIPHWLTDVALSRGFGVSRRLICLSSFQGQLCRNCGDVGETFCLACLAYRGG